MKNAVKSPKGDLSGEHDLAGNHFSDAVSADGTRFLMNPK
jgi:hypothetical protein